VAFFVVLCLVSGISLLWVRLAGMQNLFFLFRIGGAQYSGGDHLYSGQEAYGYAGLVIFGIDLFWIGRSDGFALFVYRAPIVD